MDTHDYYIGKLVYDDAWGFGLITEKTRHDRYRVWWYTAVDGVGEEWYGEVDRLYIIRFDAHKWFHDNYVLKKEMP